MAALNEKLEGSSFSHVFLNVQNQVCLHLNRPIIFHRTISQVVDKKNRYGDSELRQHKLSISIIHSPCATRCAAGMCCGKVSSSSILNEAVNGCGSQCCLGDTPSVEEARVYALVGALSNVLCACGYNVSHKKPCAVSQVKTRVTYIFNVIYMVSFVSRKMWRR